METFQMAVTGFVVLIVGMFVAFLLEDSNQKDGPRYAALSFDVVLFFASWLESVDGFGFRKVTKVMIQDELEDFKGTMPVTAA